MATPLADRRRIIRAVNRGQALEAPQDAAFAVGVARQQQRFWRRAWIFAPLIGLLGLLQGTSLETRLLSLALNAASATLIIGAMGLYYRRRAGRAEAANLEVVQAASKRSGKGGRSNPGRRSKGGRSRGGKRR